MSKYLQFKLVYAALALNFLIPAAVYAIHPAYAIAQFEKIGALLGAPSYPFAAAEGGYVWRVLGTGNVATLGFLCALLWWDLKRFYGALLPLAFLKSTASLGFLLAYLLGDPYPAFLGVFVFDGMTVAAMLFFAVRARRELA